MLSLRRLHKWLLSCMLVVSLVGISEAHTYQSTFSVFTTELVVEQIETTTATYYISFKCAKIDNEGIYTSTLIPDRINKVTLQKINRQNNTLLNNFYNYQLSYLQLLSLQSDIDITR